MFCVLHEILHFADTCVTHSSCTHFKKKPGLSLRTIPAAFPAAGHRITMDTSSHGNCMRWSRNRSISRSRGQHAGQRHPSAKNFIQPRHSTKLQPEIDDSNSAFDREASPDPDLLAPRTALLHCDLNPPKFLAHVIPIEEGVAQNRSGRNGMEGRGFPIGRESCRAGDCGLKQTKRVNHSW